MVNPDRKRVNFTKFLIATLEKHGQWILLVINTRTGKVCLGISIKSVCGEIIHLKQDPQDRNYIYDVQIQKTLCKTTVFRIGDINS